MWGETYRISRLFRIGIAWADVRERLFKLVGENTSDPRRRFLYDGTTLESFTARAIPGCADGTDKEIRGLDARLMLGSTRVRNYEEAF